MTIRAPICVVIGHIDHGKTSILDFIRKSAVVKSEAGGITQAISTTNMSLDIIKRICGRLLDNLNIKLTIPGILFIDTPGHAAFNNLRKRGGSLADIAILVVDINEGIKDQTLESIEILKENKTPFIIAANKVDLIPGWQSSAHGSLLENIKSMGKNVRSKLDTKIYEIVGKLAEHKFNSERYDRVDDYTSQIAIVPTSALSGEGLSEMLMVLTGLAQKYLEKTLNIEVSGLGRGTVLEVKEEKGIGWCFDGIIYDGHIKRGDTIVIGGLHKPIVSKVRNLFDVFKGKLRPVSEASAAVGLRIAGPNLKEVISGMPFSVANKNNLEEIKSKIQEQIEDVLFETDEDGIIVKADSLGSLEALIGLLQKQGIMIKKASIGEITKKDISEAKASAEIINRVILGFNVSGNSKDVKIITNKVIYKLIEDYQKWLKELTKKQEKDELSGLVYPAKIQLLPGCVFRQSNPAVIGVIVIGGKLVNSCPLMKSNGDKCSEIKSMQLEGENVSEAVKNKEVAISIPHITVGRQIKEKDILYSDIPEKDFITLKGLKKYLNPDDKDVLNEIAKIKRAKNPVWGV